MSCSQRPTGPSPRTVIAVAIGVVSPPRVAVAVMVAIAVLSPVAAALRFVGGDLGDAGRREARRPATEVHHGGDAVGEGVAGRPVVERAARVAL